MIDEGVRGGEDVATEDVESEPPPGSHVGPGSGIPDPGANIVGSIGDRDSLYRLLVSSIQDYGIFLLDPTGHVASWNIGAERIKGYTAREIIGQHFSRFYPDEDRASGKPWMELEVAARVGRFEDEGWRVRNDGTQFWASVIITALRDGSGELVGFAKVTRDLTERRIAEETRIADARRVAEADAANRAKGEFLAAMSHELRTPLNAIAGYADLLAAGIGGTLTTQQSGYLDRIRSSQEHLLGIINDILDFTSIEAGQIAYDVQPVSLCGVIDAAIAMIEPQAESREVMVERLPGDDAVAAADRSRVEQILLNLLSNAVKFTGQGGSIVMSCETSRHQAILRVRDSGVGIPEDRLESIFEPFVQVGRTLANPHDGTGLGLAISRDLARAMGGDLAAESSPGNGSVFTLTLPAA
ncbi:MAG: PAS domain-containing sensor histidine kinase [Gemmatimonadaceae bacterium]